MILLEEEDSLNHFRIDHVFKQALSGALQVALQPDFSAEHTHMIGRHRRIYSKIPCHIGTSYGRSPVFFRPKICRKDTSCTWHLLQTLKRPLRSCRGWLTPDILCRKDQCDKVLCIRDNNVICIRHK